MKLKIMLDPGAVMPERAHTNDAGLDLFAMETVYIAPHSRETVDTGVHVAIPNGFVGMLTSKSGLMRKNGITCRGTIDPGYTGTVQAIMFNHSDKAYKVEKGSKVTQLVIFPMVIPELLEVDEMEETERGANGFGSSGK